VLTAPSNAFIIGGNFSAVVASGSTWKISVKYRDKALSAVLDQGTANLEQLRKVGKLKPEDKSDSKVKIRVTK
jgi:hypothetical protein